MPAINLRLPPFEHAQILKVAEAKGQTVSDFARRALKAAVAQASGLSTSPKDVAVHIAGHMNKLGVNPAKHIEEWITKGVPTK